MESESWIYVHIVDMYLFYSHYHICVICILINLYNPDEV